VRATVLGELTLVDEHAAVAARQLPTRQDPVALAYLLNRSRLVARDELAEVLWRDMPPRAWEADVRAIVSKARAALVAEVSTPACCCR
jgi:DNA-binding SARP family transcriptional activator